VSNESAVIENASFLHRSQYVPYEVPRRLYISKFTRLRAVSRRQHGSCPYTSNALEQAFNVNDGYWEYCQLADEAENCCFFVGHIFQMWISILLTAAYIL